MTDLLPLTSAELADLKAKAKAATPGPWQDKYGPEAPANFELSIIANVDGDADEHGRLKMDYTPICEVADHIDGPDNLAFIIAANPETILRLVAMVERRDAWQPIETAPKDGTVVLLYCPDSWDTDWIRIGWRFGGGWYDDESASHSIADLYGEPTRWMPRPEPPK